MRKTLLFTIGLIILTTLAFSVGGNANKPNKENGVTENVATSSVGTANLLKSDNCVISGNDSATNIQYKNIAGVDPNLLSLDIYSPKAASGNVCPKKYPVMVYVHGGGWRRGDKANNLEDKVKYFTENGFVFVSVNYRLSPAVSYPVHNEDVAAAVNWVVKNVSTYKGDTGKISLMGHSAGAVIVSSISTDEKYLGAHGISLGALTCTVSLETAGYDITEKGQDDADVYLQAYGDDPDVWKEASPMQHISAGKGIPLFFVVSASRGLGNRGPLSGKRNTRRVEQSKAFVDKLNAAGSYAEILVTYDLDHEGVNKAIGSTSDQQITPKLGKFLAEKCVK